MWSEQELSLYGRLFGTWLIQVDHRGAVAHIVSLVTSSYLQLIIDKSDIMSVGCLRPFVLGSVEKAVVGAITASDLARGESKYFTNAIL